MTLTFNDPCIQQRLGSTTIDFNNKKFNTTHLQQSFGLKTLGIINPWIQQSGIEQPLDSTFLNSTILGFNKLGFNKIEVNNPGTQQY